MDVTTSGQMCSWFKSRWFVRAAQSLGVAEIVGGLGLLVLGHDGVQGFALLGIGAGTLGSAPWVGRTAAKPD